MTILNTCKNKKCPFCSHLKGSDVGIDAQPDGGVTVTGNGIQIYRMLALRSALRLEAHGFKLKGRHSVMKQVKREFGFTGSRDSIVKQYDEFLKNHGFNIDEPKQKRRQITVPDTASATIFVEAEKPTVQ